VTKNSDGPRTKHPGDQEMNTAGKAMLGFLLLVLGVVFLYLLVTLWPAVEDAQQNLDSTVTWFWRDLDLTADTTLLLLVVLVSGLGSYVHVTVSFSDFAGNRQLVSSWVWWYVLRVFVGSSLAVVFYFALRGGFFSSASDSSQVNVYGIAALAGLVGLFSKQATDKLREIFDTAFRTEEGFGDDVRSDGIANPPPTLESCKPSPITHGELEVALAGTGFNRDSIVKVARVGGPEEPRIATFRNATQLTVTLEQADIETPGTLSFVVVNPGPCGGTSMPLAVEVGAGNGTAKVIKAAVPGTPRT
jgi:hypothetical protein